eukprot:2553909-Rhodomonas_salina.1
MMNTGVAASLGEVEAEEWRARLRPRSLRATGTLLRPPEMASATNTPSRSSSLRAVPDLQR